MFGEMRGKDRNMMQCLQGACYSSLVYVGGAPQDISIFSSWIVCITYTHMHACTHTHHTHIYHTYTPHTHTPHTHTHTTHTQVECVNFICLFSCVAHRLLVAVVNSCVAHRLLVAVVNSRVARRLLVAVVN